MGDNNAVAGASPARLSDKLQFVGGLEYQSDQADDKLKFVGQVSP
jgi:hypothetical protein